MRVLLDEDLPEKLRLHISDHDAFTVRYVGLRGIRNGTLLRQAALLGFDVLITGDQDMQYQQNHRRYRWRS